MSSIELLGYSGSILLAVCGLPEAYASWKRGYSLVSYWFLYMWFFGEVFTLIYVVDRLDIPLILNYSLNILFLFITPKSSEEEPTSILGRGFSLKKNISLFLLSFFIPIKPDFHSSKNCFGG